MGATSIVRPQPKGASTLPFCQGGSALEYHVPLHLSLPNPAHSAIAARQPCTLVNWIKGHGHLQRAGAMALTAAGSWALRAVTTMGEMPDGVCEARGRKEGGTRFSQLAAFGLVKRVRRAWTTALQCHEGRLFPPGQNAG